MLHKALQQAGLSALEADIYLACLKIGTQDLTLIAREVRLPMSEVKTQVRSLLDRGFLTRYTSGKREFFTAEPPATLQRLLERDRERIDKGLSSFHQILPALEEYMRPGHERPDIAFYDGKKALVAAYEDTLTASTEIVAVASIDHTESVLQAYTPVYYRRRKAAGIPIRAIFPDTPMSRKRRLKDKQELRESRLLPASLMQMQIEWNVYDDKVAFFSLHEKIAIIIRSRLIAEAMRAMFEVLWRTASLLEGRGEGLR